MQIFFLKNYKNYKELQKKGAVPKVMSVALIEPVEMTATLNVVVSINSTTVTQTYWSAPFFCNFFIFFRRKLAS